MCKFFVIKLKRPNYLISKSVGVIATIVFAFVVHLIIAGDEFGYFYREAISWVIGCAVGALITTTFQYVYTLTYYLREPKDAASEPTRQTMSSEKFTATWVLFAMLFIAFGLIVTFFVKTIGVSVSPEFPSWIFLVANVYLALFAFFLVFVDYHLFSDHHERDRLVYLDLAVVMCVLITNVAYIVYRKWYPDFANFAVGYKAGAITFEIMLACLLFDPPLPENKVKSQGDRNSKETRPG
jgi:hypothetical protein